MQNYTTRDFYAAGYLITQRHRLISHSRANGITTFVFEEDENMQSDINKYYDLTASVEPMAYGNALKSLKSVIHSYQTNTNSNTYVQQNRNNKE